MTSLFSTIGKILAWIRAAIVNTLLIVAMLFILTAIFSRPSTPEIPQETALFLAPSGILVEQLSYDTSPLDILDEQEFSSETKLSNLVDTLELAAKDERVSALVIRFDRLIGGGVSKLEEVGQALQKFKASGKPIIVYGDSFTQAQYYLASFGDEIYLNDIGSVMLSGFGQYRLYMKEALDKLKVNFHVFRVGEYKDAVEPYIRNGMSEASREHHKEWLGNLWGRYVKQIESQRDLADGSIENYIKAVGAKNADITQGQAELALKHGLIDSVTSRTRLREKLIEQFGKDEKTHSFKSVQGKQYLSIRRAEIDNQGKKIGVIYARGTIVDGKGGPGTIGGDSMANLIRKARQRDDLKALVFRIDSGGGSAFASELIRRELLELRESGIPVYASMSSVAASGGYWIATASDQIWANPNTITGSIGVFGLFPSVSQVINKYGVYSDGVGTTELSDVFHPERELSPQARNMFQNSVENIYDKFLTIVAEARNLDKEQVHNIAQGRVWTGARAKDLGLVDQLGSFETLVASAAEQLELSSYQVVEITPTLSTREQILRALKQQSQVVFSNMQNNWAKLFQQEARMLLGNSDIEFARTQYRLGNKLLAPSVQAHCLDCVITE